MMKLDLLEYHRQFDKLEDQGIPGELRDMVISHGVGVVSVQTRAAHGGTGFLRGGPVGCQASHHAPAHAAHAPEDTPETFGGMIFPVANMKKATKTVAFFGSSARWGGAGGGPAQSCLLKSHTAGTRNSTPNPSMIATSVAMGYRISVSRYSAGALPRRMTWRIRSTP